MQLVNYRSGGLRLNPNLYACGKVCLSLLNTWSGSGCERWSPSNSTMLQVLVSVQALVLNAKPYFNEPGYAMHANTPHGEKSSLTYNEDTFLLSCRTMLYSLRNPPKVWIWLCSYPSTWRWLLIFIIVLKLFDEYLDIYCKISLVWWIFHPLKVSLQSPLEIYIFIDVSHFRTRMFLSSILISNNLHSYTNYSQLFWRH